MFHFLNNNRMLCEAKEQGKKHSPILQIIVFFLILIVSEFAHSILLSPALAYYFFSDNELLGILMSEKADLNAYVARINTLLQNTPDWLNVCTIFATVAVLVLTIVYCKCIEKRSVATMGFRKNRWVLEYSGGFVFGAFAFALVAVGCLLCGSVRFEGVNSVHPWLILLYLAAFMVQGMAEETLIHGYFMVSSSKTASVTYSLILSSMMFSFLHAASNADTVLPYINTFLIGCLLGVCFVRRGNIWGIGGFHAAWNFVQFSVCGFTVSGVNHGASVLRFQLTEGYDRLHGGAAGPEGGLIATLVCFLAFGAVLLMRPNPREVVIINNNEVTQ